MHSFPWEKYDGKKIGVVDDVFVILNLINFPHKVISKTVIHIQTLQHKGRQRQLHPTSLRLSSLQLSSSKGIGRSKRLFIWCLCPGSLSLSSSFIEQCWTATPSARA